MQFHNSPDDVDVFIQRLQTHTPEIDVTNYGVWGRISMVNELHHNAVSEALKPLGLSFNEYQIIGILYLSGAPHEMNPRDLIKLKIMTSGGLTNLLGRMEQAGLITRRPSVEDRREVIVTLTPLGLEKAQASLDGNVEAALISALTPEEVQVMTILLRKLLGSLQAAR